MMSFITVFILVVIVLVLLSQPAVGRFLDGLVAVTFFILLATVASLLVWLALFGSR